MMRRSQVSTSLAYHWLTRRAALPVYLLAGLTLGVTLAETQDAFAGTHSLTPPSPSALHMEINDQDMVTVNARDVTIRDLLTDIARRTGLVLVLSHPLDERISIEIDGMSLPKALARILKHKNFALQYTRRLSKPTDSNRQHVNWLWVLPATPGEYPQRDKLVRQFSSDNAFGVAVPQADWMNMGVRLRREAVKKLQGLDADEENLNLALADEDANTRVKAVHALADIGGDQGVAALVGALGDENPRVRAEAAHALGEIGSTTAIEILEQPSDDADNHVRQAAIEAVTAIGGDRSARALATTLQDPDASLRQEAVDALGEIGGLAATQILRQAFKDDAIKVREAAIDALTDIGGNDAAEVLATALHDAHASLRTDAVYALGEIGGETAIGLLQRALADPEPSIRELAAEILDDLLRQPQRSRGSCVPNPCPN